MDEKRRTLPQNNSLHKWLTDLGKALTEAGWDQEVLLRELEIKAPITKDFLKEDIIHPFIKKAYGKTSTAQLTTKEIQEVYLYIGSGIAEKTGISLEWPHEIIPEKYYEQDIQR